MLSTPLLRLQSFHSKSFPAFESFLTSPSLSIPTTLPPFSPLSTRLRTNLSPSPTLSSSSPHRSTSSQISPTRFPKPLILSPAFSLISLSRKPNLQSSSSTPRRFPRRLFAPETTPRFSFPTPIVARNCVPPSTSFLFLRVVSHFLPSSLFVRVLCSFAPFPLSLSRTTRSFVNEKR